mgnify:CR=1 FL=1
MASSSITKLQSFLAGKSLRLTVNGLPGAGKSTLGGALKRALATGAETYSEEGHLGGIIEAYLEDPRANAGLFQQHMASGCIHAMERMMMRSESIPGFLHYIDRDLIGNAVFAYFVTYVAKLMSTSQFKFYTTVFKNYINKLKVDQYVFLYTSPEESLKRIHSRGHQAEIEYYTDEILEQLNALSLVSCVSILSQQESGSIPLLVLDWNESCLSEESQIDRFADPLLDFQDRSFTQTDYGYVKLDLSHRSPIGEYDICLDFSESRDVIDTFSGENAVSLIKAIAYNPIQYREEKEDMTSPTRLVHLKLPLCVTSKPFEGPFEFKFLNE